MAKINYVEGQKIGNLIFLNRVESENKKSPIANFKCECGKNFVSRIDSVKILKTKSCGCMKLKFMSEGLTKHGHNKNGKKSAEYGSWQAMHARCNNPKHQNYERYKHLGITVCEEWSTFDKFIADMGLKPSLEHTIDRIENTKGYYKENCKWSTKKEQQRNKRNTTFVEYKGDVKSIPEWAELLGLSLATLYGRIVKSKWKVEKAFNEPTRNGIVPNII